MQNLNFLTIQSDVIWEDANANLKALDQLLNTNKISADVIMLPEMFNTGFTNNTGACSETMEGITINWMRVRAQELQCAITGSLIVKDGNVYYNRMVWMLPNGKCLFYDKHHLFRMGNEHHVFEPGKNKLIVDYKGWKILLLVCYDLRFPVWSMNTFSQDDGFGYDAIIYAANWPSKRDYIWRSLLTARAIENQAYVIGVNRFGMDGNGIEYHGNSLVIDFKGIILHAAKPSQPDILSFALGKNNLISYREYFKVAEDWDK